MHVDGFEFAPAEASKHGTQFLGDMLKFTKNEEVLTDKNIPLDRSAYDPRKIVDARRQRMQNILENGEGLEGEAYQVLCYNFWTPMNDCPEEVATAPLVFMDRTTMGGKMYNVDKTKGDVYIPSFKDRFYEDGYEHGKTKIYTDRLNQFGRGYVFQTMQNKKNPAFSPMTAAPHCGAQTGLDP